MASVLILGAGQLQVPAIEVAKSLGFWVIAADHNPGAVGFALADERSLVSTQDADAILQLAREKRVDFVITSTSDAPVRTVAYVSDRLGLPTGLSYENSLAATHKDHMRERLDSHGIPMPSWIVCGDPKSFGRALEGFGFDCVIKPTDSSASRGVRLVDPSMRECDAASLFESVASFSARRRVMVEECVNGPEVSVEAMTVEGRTQIVAITDKLVTGPPYFVEMGHSQPSILSESIQASIAALAERVVAAIGIQCGPSHTEIKLTPEGPKVIETAARLGGDYIASKLVPLSTGVDIVRASTTIALGLEYTLEPTLAQGSAVRFITTPIGGKVSAIRIDERVSAVSGFHELSIYRRLGDAALPPHSSDDRLGHVICTGPDAQAAILSSVSALSMVEILVE